MWSQFVAWLTLAALLAVGSPAHSTTLVSAGEGSESPMTATSANTGEDIPAAQPIPAPTGATEGMPPQPAAGPDAGAAQQAPPAVVAEPPKPVVSLRITIDLTKQQMTVDADGDAPRVWAISSARRGYRTPTGTFAPTWKARMWYSRQYDMSPMPHAIFFKDGVAIHGTLYTGMLGRPASHGCVRLAPKNAAALYALVGKHGMHATRIVVHGSPRFKDDRIARRESQYAENDRRRNFERRRSSSYVYGPVPFWAPWQ